MKQILGSQVFNVCVYGHIKNLGSKYLFHFISTIFMKYWYDQDHSVHLDLTKDQE